MSAVVCEAVCRTFHQGDALITGLDHVSLEIQPGEFLCLSGPSGSGKTTLLNAIGALDTPDGGEITVGGQRLGSLSRAELAELRLRRIGFVFQAYNLIPVLTARENVEFVMQVQGLSAARRRAVADEMLAAVGLAGLEERRPAQLSGGQQQRVAVARAVASGPDLVLADEPTANLDSHSSAHLMDLFEQLNGERGVTFVIATHDPGVMGYARRLVRMLDGRVVADEAQTPQRMAHE
ncbi:ABC transporter ATP-binding protein [Mangrovimicrobium sediminis]|uniref:ABC transporter ATP-binding protein n=1 Tax=Mangrovimicrobium sediminis TaxID=2562682 RepID=A0A4Z0LXN9_9GAMM|nr:ABC transporter ATP-binding protein [Haliea sp. SAOS-164]TGD71845.1 ABC transporter ATP-binding protein [Haliea sp. SAOS-164]